MDETPTKYNAGTVISCLEKFHRGMEDERTRKKVIKERNVRY
jgi:hypothetical protein